MIKLRNIQSLLLDTETKKVKNIEEMLDCFNEKHLNGYDYAVGWIDCFSTKNVGRGIFRKAKFSQNKKKIKINKMEQNKKFLFFPKKFMITLISFVYTRFIFKTLNFLIYNFYFMKNKKIIFNKFIWIDNNFIPDYSLIFAVAFQCPPPQFFQKVIGIETASVQYPKLVDHQLRLPMRRLA